VQAGESVAPPRARAALVASLAASCVVALLVWCLGPSWLTGFVFSSLLGLGSGRPQRLGYTSAAALAGVWLSAVGSAPVYPWPSALVVSATLCASVYLGQRVLTHESRRMRVAGAAASCAADLLQRTTRRLQALLDSVPDPLLLVDPEGRIQAAGRATNELFGTGPDDLGGRCISSLIPDFDLSRLREQASERHTDASWTSEWSALGADGAPLTCEIKLGRVSIREHPARDSEVLFLLQLRDLTHTRAREIERLHSNKMESIGQLASGIAHEINTPCQYVNDNLGYLSRLLRTGAPALERLVDRCDAELAGSLTSDERKGLVALYTRAPDGIREALEGVAHISSIVRTMHNLAHPDGTPSGRATAPVEVNRVIEETLIVSRSEWKRVARVDTQLDPDIAAVYVVPGELHQVLLNLIVNAAHAIADRHASLEPTQCAPDHPLGTIEIRSRQLEAEVLIEIQDSGVGIAPEIQARIFDPFFTTKPVGRGTGQGLAISYAIVRRHGGRIECESRPGVGTCFRIWLPRS